VVTGAAAALGAALTRPHMVSMLADLIATLQTIWPKHAKGAALPTFCKVLKEANAFRFYSSENLQN
jgi:hypothetical protein